MSKESQVNLADAQGFAVGLAKQAGELARKHYSPDIVFDPKGDNSPVTKADIEINRLVIEQCDARYPDFGVMGEEESSAQSSDWLWVCDPIDGTIPFMLGAQASTFCLALVHNGEPLIGVVNDFMNSRLYSAVKGEGAQLNGKPIGLSDARPLKLVELEVWPNSLEVGDMRKRLFDKGWHATNFASFSFMAMAVATGRIAGAVYAGKSSWDVAAAKVIAEECGCAVTGLDGNEQRYDGAINGAIVTHPAYGDEIREVARESRQ